MTICCASGCFLWKFDSVLPFASFSFDFAAVAVESHEFVDHPFCFDCRWKKLGLGGGSIGRARGVPLLARR